MRLTPGPAQSRTQTSPAWAGWRRQALLTLVLFAVCAAVAAVIIDWSRAPQMQLQAGAVAPRTVKAPVTFKFQDFEAFERGRSIARERELPVFVHQPDLRDALLERTRAAFASARERLPEGGLDPLGPAERRALREAVSDQLQRDMGVHLVDEDVDGLLATGFAPEVELAVTQLVGDAMGRLIVADRASLPRDRDRIRVLELDAADAHAPSAEVLTDLGELITAEDARQQVTLRSLDLALPVEVARATAGVARSLIRANLTFSPIQTAARGEAAMLGVRMEPEMVPRGTVLFREGDRLTERDVLVYEALRAQQGERRIGGAWLAHALFLLLVTTTMTAFGRSQLTGFSLRLRNVLSASALLLLCAVLTRVTVVSSPDIAALIGFEAEATSVWFVVPIAGAVMLVRLLMGLSWAVLFTVVTAITTALAMDQHLFPAAFFLVSGFAAAASVAQTHERIGVLRAGLGVALANAVAALSLHLLQLYVVDGEITASTAMRPVWSMVFAMGGGVLSAFLVLGLTPLFETFGFVTDYRLMELANLNHPLMRTLMLRAPGSYHHSVMVGSLAEAGAEAIGANALQAKVASYFHDIGKSLKPQFFVENQGRGGNRHDGLDPHTSAQIIISHVTEGGRMAREHKLPKPIQDNIWMHHGTGLLQYFYAKAAKDAPVPPDEARFRYPGPKPNTREAGIIMLADKVEAATRTIKAPTEESIRRMIQQIVNSVMADDQFSECPLTFQEIHTIADTFVNVLVGIYHQRIEYPQTASISAGRGDDEPMPKQGLITLDLHPGQSPDATPPTRAPQGQQAPGRARSAAATTLGDYEAVQHLPKGEGEGG